MSDILSEQTYAQISKIISSYVDYAQCELAYREAAYSSKDINVVRSTTICARRDDIDVEINISVKCRRCTSETTQRNEQRKCSFGVSVVKQDKAMARLLKRAAQRVKKMSQEEREEMHKAQSASWSRQDHD